MNLGSGNDIDAEMFSDRKWDAPFMPDYPQVVKCRFCNAIFWFKDLQEIGTFYYGDKNVPDEWYNGQLPRSLNCLQNVEAIETGAASTFEELFYVRQQIWWFFNDRVRPNKGFKFHHDEEEEEIWRTNLIEFRKILDPTNTDHKLIMAEIDRNLGNFESSKQLLDEITDPEYDWVVNAFKEAVDRKDTMVFKLY